MPRIYQYQELGWFDPSVLVEVADFIDSNGALLEAASALESQADYRSTDDLVLAALVPGCKDLISAFYRQEGPPLREMAGNEELHVFDRTLWSGLVEAMAAWRHCLSLAGEQGTGFHGAAELLRKTLATAMRRAMKKT